ncbi:phage NrS-1 polymerase family protein [Haloarchaeobius sp. DYHT-AS-18]|uniref:phage NrS-1 polymerase family protein n=1 Tax=Haloarchaeobius sp. DYHT-AS-18 TaxID=3446117 RepID=UPI003EBA641F
MTVDTEVIPEALREYDQWVHWREVLRNGKRTKLPVVPRMKKYASVSDPDTWTDFENACRALRSNLGLGFVFTEDDPFLGVDLDNCRADGALDSRAQDIVERLDSYTEVSPSGTGVHVILEGSIPGSRSRKGSVECYDSGRFFTMTGDRLATGSPAVEPRQVAFDAMYRTYVSPRKAQKSNRSAQHATGSTSMGTSTTLDDSELLEKAHSAENGQKFTRLWGGNTTGYESHSEADMALCCLLAFWTANDESRIDRLFRQSGLHRPKWDEVHYSDGTTYGKRTIERAVNVTSEVYTPPAEESAEITPSTTLDRKTQNELYMLGKRNELLEKRIADLEENLAETREALDEERRERAEERRNAERRLQKELATKQAESRSRLQRFLDSKRLWP